MTQLTAAPTTITVNFHAGPGEPALQDTAGALLAAGAEVRAGWLDDAFNATADGWNPAAVAAAFHEFGRTNVRAVFGQNGRFAAAVSGDGFAPAGKSIALWIVQTSGTALAGPYSNVTAHALVRSSTAGWIFPSPSQLPPGNGTTLALGDADQVILGVAPGGGASNFALAQSGLGYTGWRDRTFPTGAALTATGDDPDTDGVSNLVEFFAGTNPLAANAPPVAVGVENSGGQRWLVLSIDRAPLINGVAADIQTSTDQVTWTNVSDVALTGDGVAQLEQTGRVPAPDTAAGERRYLRAVVRSVP